MLKDEFPSADTERSTADDSSSADTKRLRAETRRTEFIRRAIETGTVLDMPSDRKVAQGLIDYWVVTAYAASDAEGTKPAPLSGAEALLKPFAADFMRGVAERSDAVVQKLDREGQAGGGLFMFSKSFRRFASRAQWAIKCSMLSLMSRPSPGASLPSTLQSTQPPQAWRVFQALPVARPLARRILLRLVSFSKGAWVSSPKLRDSLLSAADAARENEIIEELRKAGALVVTPTPAGENVELGYEALLRKWETLKGWIDERAKFHDAALFWEASRKNKGALLSAALAKSAAEYGDLETVEWEFIEESKKYARRRRRTAILLAILLFLIPGIPLGVNWYNKWYSTVSIPGEAAKRLAEAKSSYTSPDARKQNMVWLAERGQPFNFSRVVLHNFDLTNLAVAQANFRQARLNDVDFTGATLRSAHFDDAQLEKVKFIGADLNGAVFDQANLCEVSFSGADLTEASFLNIGYDEPTLPNFKDTAWWLSEGWNLKHVDLFIKQQGELDPSVADNRKTLSQRNHTFSQRMKGFDAKLKSSAKGSLDRMVALDGISWYRAIWGLELAAAEKTALEAKEIVQGLDPKPDILTESYVMDTLAYILLQMDRPQEARKWSEIANRAKENPGATFRHALVLHILGDVSEAEQNLNLAIRRGYWPSSELLLLRRHFSGSNAFVKTLENLSERRNIVPGPVCWPNQN